jgi:hypothetical protein
MAKQKSKKGKGSYLSYKNEGRAFKNKVKKLKRHCKKFPKDEEAEQALKKLNSPKDFKLRAKPLVPGSNRPVLEMVNYNPYKVIPVPKTPREQLAELLGIVLRDEFDKKAKKPKVKIRKKKNVRQPKKVS